MNVAGNLKRLHEAAQDPSEVRRLVDLQVVALSLTRRELEKLVVVFAEGQLHGSDAACEMAKNLG